MSAVPPGLAARESMLSVQGRSHLFLREVGGGVPLVVVHGGPDFSHDYFLPELDRLARSVRVIYYDQRGRGRSFGGEGADDVTIGSEVADLDRVRESTGSGSIALLGHSWGAVVAMEYAIRHPGRVSHLVLMNAAPASHADMLVFRASLRAARSRDESLELESISSSPEYRRGDIDADAAYHRIHFRPAVRTHADLERIVGRLRRAFAPAGLVAARAIEDSLYAQTWSGDGYDLIPELRRLRLPSLVIHGDRDFVPLEIPRRIAAAIPGSEMHVLADCGHFAFIDQPELVETIVSQFLASPA